MNKQEIIFSISARLNSMGIPNQAGYGADISVQAEFLDASWGTGKKKIEYSASCFLNDQEQIMYFWELTKETGSGISFNGESEMSFQSGTTLFRKVKSVGYGPDGKVFEYSLDIGSITKMFKETAKQNGWKFKVVLKREKAVFPAGYMQGAYSMSAYPQPFPTNPMNSTNTAYGFQPPVPQNPRTKTSLLFYFPFVLIILVFLVFFALSPVSVIGWVLGLSLLAGVFAFRERVLRLSILYSLLIWLVVFVLLFIIYGASITT
jgi:hypothetical protein